MTTGNEAADTFPKFLKHNAATFGARPAIREKRRGIWRTVSWSDLASEVSVLAPALSGLGLQHGDHVAFLGDNRPRLYAGICAVQSLGAIAVPLYHDAPAAELLPLLKKAKPTHVFAENQEQVDKLLEILPGCPSIQAIIFDEDRGMRHYNQPELVSYTKLLLDGTERPAEKNTPCSGTDTAFVFFTSGATGRVKGVNLSHDALINRARAAVKSEGLTEFDVTMAYLPPGWIAQMLYGYVQPMVTGASICCPESSDTLLADLREIAPTRLLATPRVLDTIVSQVGMRIEAAGGLNAALYRRAMKSHGATGLAGWFYNTALFSPLRDTLGMTKIRAAYSAGDAIAPAMLEFFQAIGVNLKQLYGATETGYFTTMHKDGAVKPDTVGVPSEGVELSFSETREILVRSPGMFSGYLKQPTETKAALGSDGWFRTGDIGFLGDDGQLRVIDRAADVGALNDGTTFTPRPIENSLKFNPYIREAVVLGDGRDYVCALIDINAAAVGQWADANNTTYSGHADLALQASVGGLLRDCVKAVNAELSANPETAATPITRFALLPAELNANDGLLTRTGRLKRDAISKRYNALIQALFSDAESFGFKAEDGEILTASLYDTESGDAAARRVA